MGMHREVPAAPDTYGLPEYFISDIVTEIDGPNVRVTYGVRRGGQVHWLYSTVMRADLLITCSRQCGNVATEAFNLQQLMGDHTSH
jgi:hypothetical protein